MIGIGYIVPDCRKVVPRYFWPFRQAIWTLPRSFSSVPDWTSKSKFPQVRQNITWMFSRLPTVLLVPVATLMRTKIFSTKKHWTRML